MKCILVSGGRMFDRFQALYDELDKEVVGHAEIVLRHGRCNPRRATGVSVSWDLALTYPPRIQCALLGADWHAHLHAVERGWLVEERPADWNRYGKAAGGIRNQEMVDEQPTCDVLVAAPDPNSRGTYDCARRAQAAGIPVVWVRRWTGRYGRRSVPVGTLALHATSMSSASVAGFRRSPWSQVAYRFLILSAA